MHEDTIFAITRRVDFLDMPILDSIEENENEWYISEIDEYDGSEDTVSKIIHDFYFQQAPVIFTELDDTIGIIDHLQILEETESEDLNHFVKNSRGQADSTELYIYSKFNFENVQNFDKNYSNSKLMKLLKSKDPLEYAFDLVSVWHKRTTESFKTIPVRSNTQKLI